MRVVPFLSAALLTTSCAPPVMFRVDVDEPIQVGTLTLNGRSAELMKNVDGAYWGKWNGSDAAGQIEIMFADRKSATCRIGYVSHGITKIQQFEVKKRVCNQVIYQ